MSDLNWPGGLISAAVLAVVGVMLLRVTRDHRDTLAFQRGLFLAVFGVRFALSLAIYAGGLVRVLQDEDSMGWLGGVVLMEQWHTEGVSLSQAGTALHALVATDNHGYQALLGLFFTLTRMPGRLTATALTSWISAFGVIFVYRAVRSLATEQAARGVSLVITALPLMLVWSSQTVKEPVVITMEAAALYACVRISCGSLAPRHIGLALVSLSLVTPFRFYIAYALGAGLIVAMWRNRAVVRAGTFVRAGVTGLVVVLLALLTQEVRREVHPGLERVQRFRNAVSPGGTAVASPEPVPEAMTIEEARQKVARRTGGVPAAARSPALRRSQTPRDTTAVAAPESSAPPRAQPPAAAPAPSAAAPAPPPTQVRAFLDARNPIHLPFVVLYGAAHVLLAPFPWQFGGVSLRFLLTAPDMLMWWLLFFFVVVPGVWRALRSRLLDVAPLVIFVVAIGGLYSLMYGNIGITYRQRAQLVPVLLTLAAAGLAPARRETT